MYASVCVCGVCGWTWQNLKFHSKIKLELRFHLHLDFDAEDEEKLYILRETAHLAMGLITLATTVVVAADGVTLIKLYEKQIKN